jgi:carotenoid 1,2-hydratase
LREGRPRFDRAIASGGYEWFYVDGVSDDGRHAIVVIALLGNPFSPRYARARREGRANPLAFSAMNVAIHGPSGSRWALTERAVDPSDRSADGLSLGQSSMRWEGERLIIDVRERTPWTRRPIEGRITFHPHFTHPTSMALDPDGKHAWWPVAPSGALDVRLSEPDVSFRARGYHDSNAGDEPLEAAFRSWTWSRAHARNGANVTYDVVLASGEEQARAVSIRRDGLVPLDGLTTAPLPASGWHVSRKARTAPGFSPRIERPLEDTPFYARDVIQTRIEGATVRCMHETLSLTRLARRSVQFLLPFRMRQEERVR